MNVPFLLSDLRMRRIEPYFPLAHGVSRVDDRVIISGIIYVLVYDLIWRDVPKGYGSHKTIYNRFVRWSKMGIFDQIFVELAEDRDDSEQLFVDLPRLKAHRTSAKLYREGCFPNMTRAHEGSGDRLSDKRYYGQLTGYVGPLWAQPAISYFKEDEARTDLLGANVSVVFRT